MTAGGILFVTGGDHRVIPFLGAIFHIISASAYGVKYVLVQVL